MLTKIQYNIYTFNYDRSLNIGFCIENTQIDKQNV